MYRRTSCRCLREVGGQLQSAEDEQDDEERNSQCQEDGRLEWVTEEGGAARPVAGPSEDEGEIVVDHGAGGITLAQTAGRDDHRDGHHVSPLPAEKFDLRLLSQCGSTYNCLGRSVPWIH